MSLCTDNDEIPPCKPGKCPHCDMGYLVGHALSEQIPMETVIAMFMRTVSKLSNIEIGVMAVDEDGSPLPILGVEEGEDSVPGVRH